MRRRLFIPTLVVASALVQTSAIAAPQPSIPSGINLYNAGTSDPVFQSIAATPNGWVFVGTAASDLALGSWTATPTIGGDDILVVMVDAAGKPGWSKRIGTDQNDAGLLVAVDKSTIWTLGVTTKATVIPATPTPSAAPSANDVPILDPDNVGVVADNEGVSGPNLLVLSQLSLNGDLVSQTVIPAPDGLSLAPAKLLITPAGLAVVGSTASDEIGAVRGFVLTLDAQLQPTFNFVGTASTSITDADLTARGLQLVGASSELLATKKPIGLRDAFTGLWANGSLTNVVRVGAAGVDRSWTSISQSKDGFLLAGWSESKGKTEALVSSLSRTGKPLFTLRYPGAEDQAVFSGNRVLLSTRVGVALGWKSAGADLLVLTLDGKGRVTALTPISGPGEEELAGFAVGTTSIAILGRTSGTLPKAVGTGSVLLARIAR